MSDQEQKERENQGLERAPQTYSEEEFLDFTRKVEKLTTYDDLEKLVK